MTGKKFSEHLRREKSKSWHNIPQYSQADPAVLCLEKDLELRDALRRSEGRFILVDHLSRSPNLEATPSIPTAKLQTMLELAVSHRHHERASVDSEAREKKHGSNQTRAPSCVVH